MGTIVDTSKIMSSAKIIGLYECHLYDNGGKNDWHYVTITQDTSGQRDFVWTNRAGVSWSLYRDENLGEYELRVGEDCPYYSSGYTVMKKDDDGVHGPGGELYNYEGVRITQVDFTNVQGMFTIPTPGTLTLDWDRPQASGQIDETEAVHTGLLHFPDDRRYSFWYYPQECNIYWDNDRGQTDNIWYGNIHVVW